jgi:hypothetical protein
VARKLTAREKVKRDLSIVADRARGFTWGTISSRHDLSVRQCQTVYAAHLAIAVPLEQTGVLEALQEMVMQLDATIEDLAMLSESANESVRLGAVKARHAALLDKAEVLRASGLLPHAADVTAALDFDVLGQTIVDVLDAHSVGDDLRIELVERLHQVAWPSERARATARS